MTPNEYWNQNIQYSDQKFYTSLCLLQSSLADYALACDLKNRNCLNWAATTYYYSIVHSARLICFLAVGDFPTSHERLAKLFKNELPQETTWLRQFDLIPGISISLSDIVQFYQYIESPLSRDEFVEIGNALDSARKCRNDSNYEMLIMAHEFQHFKITSNFMRLTDALKRHSERVLPKAIHAFKFFIEKRDGINLNERAAYWNSYLNWNREGQGLKNIFDFISFRLNGNYPNNDRKSRFSNNREKDPIIRQIKNWVSPLETDQINISYAENVLDNVLYGIFNGKKRLMIKFSEGVNTLESQR